MKKYLREQQILEIIKDKKFLTTKEYYKITDLMAIKPITARRDLQYFQEQGYIKVELGAIEILDQEFEKPRLEKKNENLQQKTNIAQEAIKLIKPNDIIYLSPGTTCEAIVKAISSNVNMVVTNGLEVFMKAKNNKFIQQAILIGGRYRNKSSAFVGRDAINILENYQFSLSFFTGTNIDQNLDIFNNNDEESMIFLKALSRSKYKVGLFDSSKFTGTGLSYITSLKEMDLIITDKLIDRNIKQNLEKTLKTKVTK